jgi:Leucine-rich repeat (LRR) protein
MVEPMAVSIAGTVASKLLGQVMEATKIAISCNKCCKVLQALLKELQPIVDHAVRQISQSNFDNAFKSPRSAVHYWLDELEGTLKRAAVEVNKCIKQQPDLNPVSRYNTGKRILEVTESVKKLLQQAGLVGLAVTFSETSRAQKMEKMMQEQHEMMDDLRATALRIEFATFTQESLQEKYTTSSAQGVTSARKSAFYNLWQNLSLRPSDNMSRVDTGASSSSSCPRELIVNEDAHKLTDIQQVPQLVIGLDNFTMRSEQSITSSSIDAEPRCVGVWGMGGAGKTLLAQIAYNSREVRKHFKGGELIWLTVSQTPNIKGLYDSFWRQLGLRPTSFQLEEYRTRLYNEFLRRRVFIVLDDVWDKGVLEQLDLAKGRGSVTLVTTRNQPVSKKAGVIDEDEVQIGVLSKEDSWKLFCVHAFPRGLSNIPSQLQEVPESVAEECKGLPLALKVIGGSMVGKTTRQEWEFQLKCLRESRELPQQQEEEALFGRLKLSYDNLDNDNPVSKECFLGFAAFPEDYIVEMEELIKSWKAQGLLDDPTKMFGDDPTRSAYYLVGLLIGRSFIELAQTDAYKVHDVMRGMALHIIEGQKWITCLYRPGKELVEFPKDWIQTYERQPCEVRKLSLLENDLTTLNGVTFSAPKLQVLLLARNEKLEAMPKQFLRGIENLKALDLSKCRKLISLPREIGNLTQLTHLYLDFCQNLESLPEEMGKLTQLTRLHLNQCGSLKSLPKEVGKLTQLTHLHLNQCGNLKSLPKEVGKFTQLTHLHLNQCGNLKSLPKEVGNLTQLTLLHLNQCGNLKSLPKEVGKLTQLTHLHLNQCGNLKSLPKEVGKLTQLTHLHLNQCANLKSLPKEVGKLTQLTHLHLNQCGNLKSLPKEVGKLTQLIHLDLSSCCGLKKLPKSIGYLQSLQWVKITDCSNLKYLPSTIYNG